MSQEYPATPVPGKMADLLNKIPTLGIPEKVNFEWLRGLGYRSSNDKQTLAAMRRLGMIGTNSAPTDVYRAFRNKNGERVAAGIRDAYKDLFAVYPDAHRKDAETLQNFFRSKTDANDKVQRQMVQVFQLVTKHGDFGDAGATTPSVPAPQGSAKPQATPKSRSVGGGVTLNVNIQLQLPASADGDVYEKLFEAMGKHLKGLTDLE